MQRIKIGIRLESLGLPVRRALQEAERLGVGGVQVDAVGDLAPNSLSQTGRREFRHLLRAHNLELTAVGCPLRHGLGVAENQEPRIEHVRNVLALSFDLGPRVAIVQAGRVPEDPSARRGSPDPAALLREALLSLGQYGDRSGTTLALETGLETGNVLAAFLAQFDTGGLGVNYDPANLLMNGFDPYESGRALHGRIVHAHAKDARAASASRSAREVPLGHGDLDWMRLLGVLEEIDYRGWLTIEQESGENRRADIEAGVGFLRRFVGP
jgi:sugar phosphate isomerase/epimerase